MNSYQKKELEGRYAAKKLFPGRKYDFTEFLFERYDAYSTGKTECLEEIKAYNNPEHPRTHNKWGKYFMADYSKLLETTLAAMNMEVENGVNNKGFKDKKHRQPLFVGIFWDMVCVWDLDKTNWEDTHEYRWVNATGVNYGKKKEWAMVAYLPIDGDEGPIYKEPIKDPVTFWKEVAEVIKKDYPEYEPSWENNNN